MTAWKRGRAGWPWVLSLGLCLLLLPLLGGCALQQTWDQKVYRVASAEGTNYYRVRICSYGFLGDVKYRTGWYETEAIDAFAGHAEGPPREAARLEADLRTMVLREQERALSAYFQASTPAEAEAAVARLQRVQQVPLVLEPEPGKGGTLHPLRPSPVRRLVDHRADKRFVIALANDPDAILERIAAFSSETKTRNALFQAFQSMTGLRSERARAAGLLAVYDAAQAAARLERIAQESPRSLLEVRQALTEAQAVGRALP